MIKLGQRVAFNQRHYIPGGGGEKHNVIGTVIYVNEPHRYFTTQYKFNGRMWLLSFNFHDVIGIGQRGFVRRVR